MEACGPSEKPNPNQPRLKGTKVQDPETKTQWNEICSLMSQLHPWKLLLQELPKASHLSNIKQEGHRSCVKQPAGAWLWMKRDKTSTTTSVGARTEQVKAGGQELELFSKGKEGLFFEHIRTTHATKRKTCTYYLIRRTRQNWASTAHSRGREVKFTLQIERGALPLRREWGSFWEAARTNET